jgi:peptidoglycan hydrolase-like protein with peptidoglycan-binding domain
MKKAIFILIAVLYTLVGFSQVNQNYHHVKGYYRSNGTYVKGYNRTNPNHTNRDNYSTSPNTNPWTGKRGTIAPDNNYLPSTYTSTPSYNYTLTNSNDYKSTFPKSNYSSNYSYSTSASSAVSYHYKYSLNQRYIIEQFLKKNDFDPGTVDGVFTQNTIAAIKKLQRFIGVTADGKFGSNTLEKVTQLLE